MTYKKLFALLMVCAFTVNSVFALGNDEKATTRVAKLNKDTFVGNIKTALDGKVMGYQVILLKNGQIAAETANGWARNNADGNLKMTTSTPANIGSSAKFFGGLTLLQAFEKNKSKTVDEWLDSKMFTYFPTIWKLTMHPSIKQITFRDLLEHRGGFIHNDSAMDGDMYNYLVKGVALNPAEAAAGNGKDPNYYHGKRNYANANMQALTFLIPAIVKPDYKIALDLFISKNNVKAGDIYIQEALADQYEQILRDNLFEKATPQISATCRPSVETPATYAREYPSKMWISPSNITPKNAKGCYAVGGWYISARNLAAFVANFNASETFVSKAVRAKMFNDEDADNRLVWSRTTTDSWFNTNFGMDTLPYHGGDAGGGRATILMLGGGYYAVGIINSADFSSGELTTILRDAFKGSVTF